jgi:cell division control protein 45
MRYQLHTLILLNIGSILDLPSSEWFGDFPPRVHVHVIDSGRPQNLSSLFGGGDGSERVIIWDDGGAERLDEERKAWETLNVSVLWPAQPASRALIVFLLKNEPEPDSDASSDDDLSEDLPEDSEEEGVQSHSRKRRSLSDGSRTPSKRKRLDIDVGPLLSLASINSYGGFSVLLAHRESSVTDTSPCWTSIICLGHGTDRALLASSTFSPLH